VLLLDRSAWVDAVSFERDLPGVRLRMWLVAFGVLLGIGCLPSSGFSPSALGAGASTSGPPTGKLAVKAVATKWPDGSPVESGGNNYPNDIYIVDVEGRDVRNLTHDQRTETWMSWLPDGRRIVYENVPNDQMKPGASHIFVIRADGSDRHLLASGQGGAGYGGGLSPALSPEGRRILFVAHGMRQRGLYVMQTDGRRKKRLTHSREEEASWSPNARQIAFVRGFGTTQNPRSDILVINADGSALHRLTRTMARESHPVWSPDGRRIVFVRTFAGPSDVQDFVYVMRADGTGVKRLAQGDGPAWFSNNLVGYSYGGGYSWWSIDANGAGKPRPLRLPGRTRIGDRLVDRHGNDLGALSPNGKWIAFSTYGRTSASAHRIWVAHADGTHRRFITRKVCCLYLEIEWGPN
jgi:Tol biopolymer transport system component